MPLAGYTVVYGGSFNPPHMGHQMACLYLLEALGAHHVWLVPSRLHPFGKPLASVEARVEMCRRLATPFAGRVTVSLVEAEGALSGRTYDTLVSLCREHPERRFALAIGSDLVAETKEWHRWRDIETMVRVVVIGRAGAASDLAAPLLLPNVSSSEVRARIKARQSIEGLVPVAVAEYIEQHSLYGP